MEFVSPEGLRLDGRRPKELRALRCQLNPLPQADGSAIFEMGNTKVGLLMLNCSRHSYIQDSASDLTVFSSTE